MADNPVDITNTTPIPITFPGGISLPTGNFTDFGQPSDPDWDGTSTSKLLPIMRYIGKKMEAVRALLAGGIATTGTDGSQATIGNTSDVSSASTLVGLLKAIKAAVTGTLTTSNTAIGATSDAAYTDATLAATGTNIALAKGRFGKLEAIRALLAGTINTAIQGTPTVAVTSIPAIPAGSNAIGSVSVSNLPVTQPISGTDGSQATIGSTSDASSANTLVGLLKAVKTAVTGTLNVLQNNPVSSSLTVAISSGQSLSGAIQIGNGASIVGFVMPSSWTTAALTLQFSRDGINYGEINNLSGPYSVPSASISAYALVTDSDFLSALASLGGNYYIKVRSGTVGSPVTQSSNATIYVLTKAV